jgi:predicted DNA-binding antitoxin AbrB/MazE fold protein
MVEVHNMARQRFVIPGIVQNGLVVPQNDTPLPEGTRVEILIRPAEMMPELQAELAQWEKASTEAWTLLNQWAAEDR